MSNSTGIGVGVGVGSGVEVGAGVEVGWGVGVGSGVAVGAGVEVGVGGTVVGVGSGVPVQAAKIAITNTSSKIAAVRFIECSPGAAAKRPPIMEPTTKCYQPRAAREPLKINGNSELMYSRQFRVWSGDYECRL